MPNSTLGCKYYDENNDVQGTTDTQESTERFSDLLADFVIAVSALVKDHEPNASGAEPPGIPVETSTLKVTKWKSDGVWTWVETPKGNLTDNEWAILHAMRVTAAQDPDDGFPPDA